jgi:hypothetical protein
LGWQAASVAQSGHGCVSVVETTKTCSRLSALDILRNSRPGTGEVKLIESDAHAFKPERPVDILRADIWEQTDSQSVRRHIRKHQPGVISGVEIQSGTQPVPFRATETGPSPANFAPSGGLHAFDPSRLADYPQKTQQRAAVKALLPRRARCSGFGTGRCFSVNGRKDLRMFSFPPHAAATYRIPRERGCENPCTIDHTTISNPAVGRN